MTDYKALADRLESYIPQELGRAEEFGTDLAQAANILRQVGTADIEVVMKCAMQWVSAPFSHQRRENLDASLRALAVRVPEGWQSVPVEPTDGMRRAGWNAYLSDGKGGLERFAITYRAMLAAAPQPKDQS